MIQLQTEQRSSASSSSAELLAIEPANVVLVWPFADSHLAKAMRRTQKWNLELCRKACEEKNAQLWIVWYEHQSIAAVVTDLIDHETGHRAGRIVCLGGERFHLWGHLVTVLEDWARAEGCDTLEMIGRKGWGRLFPDYKPIEYVYAKELGGTA